MNTTAAIYGLGTQASLLTYLDQFNPDDISAAQDKIYKKFMEKIEADIQVMMGIPKSIIHEFEVDPVYRPEPYRFNPWLCGAVINPWPSFLTCLVCDCEGSLLTKHRQAKLDSAIANSRRADHAGYPRRAKYWTGVANRLLKI